MKIIGIIAFCILLFGCSKPAEDPLLNNPSQECINIAAHRIKEYRESQYGRLFTAELYQEIVAKNKEILKEECS